MGVVQRTKDTRVFLEECWAELLKVTWPDWEQLRSATLVVILFTIAISLVIWLMDSLVSLLLRTVMGIFGA